MRETSLHFYRCPRCRSSLTIDHVAEQSHEIRSGRIHCQSCAADYDIRRGIAYLVLDDSDLSDFKKSERDGWGNIATAEVEDAIDDSMLADLPCFPGEREDSDHWRQAALVFPAVLASMAPLAGKRVLDFGSSIGWAAHRFAELGAEVVAVDMNDHPSTGLGKADIFLNQGPLFFERLCADAENLPLADESCDFVFCCATIHHLERPELALREVARILRPGGAFIAINEAYRPLLRSRDNWLRRSSQTRFHLDFGIHEQIFTHREYRRFFTGAGLEFSVIHPRWDIVRTGEGLRIGRNLGLKQSGFQISDTNKSASRRWAHQLGLERLLKLDLASALARSLLLHFTNSYRILVGRKDPGWTRKKMDPSINDRAGRSKSDCPASSPS